MGKRSVNKPAPTTQAPPNFNWRDFDPAWLPGGAQAALATELVTYRDHLDELLRHEGQYVVIKGTTILGIYRNWRAAIKVAESEGRPGFEATGYPTPILVKRIVEIEPVRRLGHVIL
jgi:hypothetical protein